MSEAVLSVVQVRALEALATYRLLTVPLMRAVGVSRDPKPLREALRVLDRWRFIGRTETTPFLPGVGRLPVLYWLRPEGSAELAELRDIPPPPSQSRPVRASEEIPHRIGIVETHVALRLWAASAGASVDWFKGAFEPGSGALRHLTTMSHGGKGETYTPDAVASVTLADGKPRLLVMEVYRGGRRESLDHFRRKLPQLFSVAAAETVEDVHAFKSAARFLVVFTSRDMAIRALKGWPAMKPEDAAQFFVAALPFSGNFNDAWFAPDGAPKALFDVKYSA